MNIFEEITMKAFNDELEKMAGVVSEVLGSAGTSSIPYLGPFAALGGMIGAAATPTYSDKEMKESQKAIGTNFIPGIGTYRLFKRLGWTGKKGQEMTEKTSELKKEAGVVSEFVGSAVNPLSLIATPISAIAAAATPTYSDKEFKEAHKAVASNILVPGMATYRYWKRLGYSQKKADEMIEKEKKQK